MSVVDERDSDFEVIAQMLAHAEKEGLLTEVVWSFVNCFRDGGMEVPQAAAEALYSWDI